MNVVSIVELGHTHCASWRRRGRFDMKKKVNKEGKSRD